MVVTPARKLSCACDVEAMRVETGAGVRLGHVFDVRCRWNRQTGGAIVDEVIYGTIGLAERLGLDVSKPSSVRWSEIVAIHADRVVVEPTRHASEP